MRTLAQYRQDKNLTQIELSEALRLKGVIVSPASIAMYEVGKRTPPLEKAQAIARFFGIATDDIFFGSVAHLERAQTPTGTTG